MFRNAGLDQSLAMLLEYLCKRAASLDASSTMASCFVSIRSDCQPSMTLTHSYSAQNSEGLLRSATMQSRCEISFSRPVSVTPCLKHPMGWGVHIARSQACLSGSSVQDSKWSRSTAKRPSAICTLKRAIRFGLALAKSKTPSCSGTKASR